MLVLRRKTDEALVMNGAVTIVILGVEGERVKVGIIAPPDVVVLRGELVDAERQRVHLRRKREELARETDPRQREKLAHSLERLEQSTRLLQPALAPVSPEARQEERRDALCTPVSRWPENGR
jgi:carbon storage regulator